MKLKLIIITFIIINIVNSIYGKIEEKYIYGFWGDAFPIPSSVYGYIFFDDYSFIFFDIRENENIKSKYFGTYGNWKIEGDKLYINQLCHLFWKDNLEKTNAGYLPERNNTLLSENAKSQEWIYIADLTNLVRKETTPNELNFYYIINKEVSKKTKKYYRLYPLSFFPNVKWLNDIISSFDKCKSITKIECNK